MMFGGTRLLFLFSAILILVQQELSSAASLAKAKIEDSPLALKEIASEVKEKNYAEPEDAKIGAVGKGKKAGSKDEKKDKEAIDYIAAYLAAENNSSGKVPLGSISNAESENAGKGKNVSSKNEKKEGGGAVANWLAAENDMLFKVPSGSVSNTVSDSAGKGKNPAAWLPVENNTKGKVDVASGPIPYGGTGTSGKGEKKGKENFGIGSAMNNKKAESGKIDRIMTRDNEAGNENEATDAGSERSFLEKSFIGKMMKSGSKMAKKMGDSFADIFGR